MKGKALKEKVERLETEVAELKSAMARARKQQFAYELEQAVRMLPRAKAQTFLY